MEATGTDAARGGEEELTVAQSNRLPGVPGRRWEGASARAEMPLGAS